MVAGVLSAMPTQGEEFQDVDVTRRGSGGSYDSGGRWSPDASTSTVTIKASIQPMRPESKEAQFLPEGVRIADVRMLITDTALRVGNTVSDEEADEVVIDGETFRVIDGSFYPTVLAHGEYVAAKVQAS